MTSGVYARRYSQAAFKMALESKELNRWQSDLRKVASLAKDEAAFTLLENSKVSFNEKAKMLSERLGEIPSSAPLDVSHPAVDELRQEFADLTIEAAGKVIEKSLDKEAHRELIDKVLDESTNLKKD